MAMYQVRISTAAMGTRRVGVANLPPEVSDGVLRLVLSGYRGEMDIQAELWSRLYRYPHSIRNDYSRHTHSVAYYCGWPEG